MGGGDSDVSRWNIKGEGKKAHLLETLLHHLWAVVDGEDDIRDAGLSEGLNLVENHGPVAELDQGLGEGEGLQEAKPAVSISVVFAGWGPGSSILAKRRSGEKVNVREVGGGCRSRRQELKLHWVSRCHQLHDESVMLDIPFIFAVGCGGYFS